MLCDWVGQVSPLQMKKVVEGVSAKEETDAAPVKNTGFIYSCSGLKSCSRIYTHGSQEVLQAHHSSQILFCPPFVTLDIDSRGGGLIMHGYLRPHFIPPDVTWKICEANAHES